MAQKLIQLRSHFHHPVGRLLLYYHIPHFVTVRLPVRLRDRYRPSQRARLHLERFEDEESFAQVAVGVTGNFEEDRGVVSHVLFGGDVF